MTTNNETVTALTMPEEDGLVFACRLNGQGGAEMIDWQAVESWQTEQGPVWVHLDRTSDRAKAWLRDFSGLTPVTCDAILAEETRPRVFHGRRGYVAILRGVNTNPHTDPEDLVSLRIWSDGIRVISLRRRKLLTPRDVLAELIEHEAGPRSASELFERLITRLTERMEMASRTLQEAIDDIDEQQEQLNPTHARRELSVIRQSVLTLRRFMSPQREALNQLYIDPPAWLENSSRLRLRETNDQIQRYVEELDMNRERTALIKDEIANRLAENLNRNMYLLSIVAALFLPLSFATGLLGINVGGMPGAESKVAFWIVCTAMVVVAVVEVVLFRKLKWL